MSASFSAAITGVGIISPAGIGCGENWKTVVAGKPTAAVDASLDGCPCMISCRVPPFDPADLGIRNPWQWDRFSQFAFIAVMEALADAGLKARDWNDASRVGVVIGTGAGGTETFEEQYRNLARHGSEGVSPLSLPMALLNMAAGQVAIEIGARGPCFTPVTACASGATAIGLAREMIRNGQVDIVVAGGAEAPITPFYVSAFARMKALSPNPDPATASRPFDESRNGFVIGEGAAILVMEAASHAKARGARIRGFVSGYGASADAHHVTSPHPQGEGARLSMDSAIKSANLAPSDIGYVNAHGTSTQANDFIESSVICGLLGENVPVSSTKGVTGHLLGAAGAAEAAFTLFSLEAGMLPPTAGLTEQDARVAAKVLAGRAVGMEALHAISNSFGFGGQNASLVISKAGAV
ncbi:MAG: beta-ketoacyl-[acyl-carrier-protein] synthase family protein [Alphaproteobacteria bacterium]|jgi:3-oxoacyl-[acyl-carrier-protein] synthase II|nr:beta-ketoacyl-[acyl-carrier-protein] synthase family protein [Alphaproteobacteria bacterium]MBU1550102.1 beta-ketoacyl-[acyl-carrier-protein] synthase family protein [Alphaproteobacteria bacterium]MBU2337096.1 beta-ketoacyl-[acyl-carrier-protein] synthase family protein [Alphaproteobacteria bacterium]MBU2389427.1 beta-ketoacyl-[acyl-carrier-protein] synthase family protein [Alphaproteobacteria bacterium]